MKQLKVTVNGKVYDVSVEEIGGTTPVVASVAPAAPVAAAPAAPAAAPVATAPAAPAPAAAPVAASAGSETVTSPMPGVILKIPVEVGQKVAKDDVLIVLEAMKMENEIFAPCDGVVASINVSNGESVEAGKTLVTLN